MKTRIDMPMHLVGYDLISHYRREEQLAAHQVKKHQDRKEAKLAGVWLVSALLLTVAFIHLVTRL